MKKIITISSILSCAIIVFSCTHTSEVVTPVPPPSSCDTTNMSYSKDIVPILTAYCYICHSGDAANGGGIHLNSYATVWSKAVDEASLIPAITHDGTVAPMPYPRGSAKMPDCNINKIIAWVNQGAQNN